MCVSVDISWPPHLGWFLLPREFSTMAAVHGYHLHMVYWWALMASMDEYPQPPGVSSLSRRW